MNKLFLLFLLLVPSIVFGATFDDEWPLYVFGDASYYKLIYDGIAMTVQSIADMTPIYESVFAVSALFTAFSFSKADLTGGLWHTASGLGIVSMLLYPTSTVHILDVRTLHGFVYADSNNTNTTYSGYQKVDNIPFYLAVVPSLATSLKYHIIDISTDALTPISGGSFRDSGFATPMTLAEDMISVASFKYSRDTNYTAPKFEQALSKYIESCIINEVLYIDDTQIFGIMDPKGQQLDALKPSNFSAMNLANTPMSGTNTTCGAFWDTNIATKINLVGGTIYENLKGKNPKININGLADSVARVAGIESATAIGATSIQNAMMNIATTGTILSTFEKAGTGLSGIDLSNSVAAKQSLFANMTDSTGQFKWMIKVVPVLEFLIFGILIFLGIPMGIVAGLSGADRGGKMLMNFAFGLVAFSFIDVALSIVQSISLYYYGNKMSDAMIMLGQNPFTATNIPLYMQELGYMSGMMGLASVIVVPLVVGVVFKGETAAAMGAYSSVMGKYKGDGGGKNLEDSASHAAAAHAAEAKQYEDAARRELAGGYGITEVPNGALASQMLERVSAEAAGFGANMGAQRVAQTQFGSNQDYTGARVNAGMGTGMQKVTAEIASGQGLLESINKDAGSLSNFAHQTKTDSEAGFEAQASKGRLAQSNPLLSRDNQIEAAIGNAEMDLRKTTASGLGASKAFKDGAGDDFSYQTQTDSEAGIKSTATKGKFSKDHEEFDRKAQVGAAMVMATDGLVKSVAGAKGLVESMAFNSDGSMGSTTEFDEYAKGTTNQSRIAANKVMGAGREDLTHDEMQDVKRTEQANIKSLIAKGDALQQSFGSNLNESLNGQSYDTMITAQEKGNFSASTQAIKTAGGENGFVALQKAGSSMRTAQSMASVNANESFGFLDSHGNMTEKGSDAFSISPTEMAAQLGVKESVLFGKNAGKNMVSEIKSAALKAGKSSSDINSALNSFGLTDANGENPASGLDLVAGLAKMGAMNYSSSKALSFMGMTMSANIDGQGNAKVVKADGGMSVNTTNSTESGEKDTYNNNVKALNSTNPLATLAMARFGGNMQKAAEYARSAEGAKWAMDPRNELSLVAAEAGHQISDATGMSAEGSAILASSLGAGGAGLLLANKLTKQPIKFGKDGLSKLSPILDDNDNVKGYEDSEGNKVADKDGYATDKRGKRIESGVVGRAMRSSANGFKSATDKLRGINDKTFDDTPSSGTNNQNGKYNDSSSQHDKSFNSDANNIANKNESVKSGTQLTMDFDTPDTPKGFMAKRMEAFSEAMHGGGSWKTKLGLAASAVVLGEASATAGQLMQAADPTSFITGTEAGSGAFGGDELKQMMAAKHQGVFTQPTGFNTMQALQQDQVAQSQISSAGNLQTIASLSQARSGGFTMSDNQGQPVSFTTDKGAGHNLMMNGQSTGMGYQQFSSMMQNGDMAAQFSNAISSSDINNKDAYNTTNQLLQDMNYQSTQANMRQRVHNNASDTHKAMQHKEVMESNSNEDKENELY